MLVPRLIDSVRAGRAVRVRGERGTQLNPVHVDDAVTLIEACLGGQGSRVLNVAGPEVVTIRDMTERIAELVGGVAVFESEAGAPESYVADITAMRALVQRPLLDFATGVASMLAGVPR
jgi:nucleoside-diphosphate-sugar epimerase